MNIILCGPGRSGTTLFNTLFSYHKDFAWISGWVNRYPSLLVLSFFNTIYRFNFLHNSLRKTPYLPKPAEAYGFWNYYILNFTSQNGQVSQTEIKKVSRVIEAIKHYSRCNHFVTKITGQTRHKLLDAIFKNDITYIWIERDPRVVVSSYIKQKWGYKKNPLAFSELSMEEKIRINCNRYLEFYHESKAIEKKVLFYEDLCNDPLLFFEELFQELALNFELNHRKFIANHSIKKVTWENTYKHTFEPNHQALFNELLATPLKHYGYL